MYLKTTPSKSLLFAKGSELVVVGYTDTDWTRDQTYRSSEHFTFVGGNFVTWKIKKQKVVARSSAGAKFQGMTHDVCKLLWIKNMIKDLGFKFRKPIYLHIL